MTSKSEVVRRLRGECVVCGAMLTEKDYDAQQVIMSVGPQGVTVEVA